ncbi:DUF1349 domain-containing protein [Catellatospora sp. NPDC049609]|uniref:DUF1349 domain-containing protein n=1 Tax=Catellatospora sp. NPDC049609 TaxID=3155505 RepID=UPI00343654BB
MDLTLGGLALRWQAEPASWHLAGGVLSVAAGPRTDMFVDPGDPAAPPVLNAPRALTAAPEGDFTYAVRARVDFAEKYDAGVLLVWAGERHWAKLCFERSPAGENTIVTVITRGDSDDANSWPVDGDTVWLRAARVGPAWAFHSSSDGRRWQLVRYFSLGPDAGPPLIGVEAQSPVGDGCTVVFDHATLTPGRLADLRDGS